MLKVADKMNKINKKELNQICDLLKGPENIQMISKFPDSVKAYGNLEYLNGWYSQFFKEFRVVEELSSEVRCIEDVAQILNVMMDYISEKVPEERQDVMKRVLDGLALVAIHNLHKKDNAYHLDSGKSK